MILESLFSLHLGAAQPAAPPVLARTEQSRKYKRRGKVRASPRNRKRVLRRSFPVKPHVAPPAPSVSTTAPLRDPELDRLHLSMALAQKAEQLKVQRTVPVPVFEVTGPPRQLERAPNTGVSLAKLTMLFAVCSIVFPFIALVVIRTLGGLG